MHAAVIPGSARQLVHEPRVAKDVLTARHPGRIGGSRARFFLLFLLPPSLSLPLIARFFMSRALLREFAMPRLRWPPRVGNLTTSFDVFLALKHRPGLYSPISLT